MVICWVLLRGKVLVKLLAPTDAVTVPLEHTCYDGYSGGHVHSTPFSLIFPDPGSRLLKTYIFIHLSTFCCSQLERTGQAAS